MVIRNFTKNIYIPLCIILLWAIIVLYVTLERERSQHTGIPLVLTAQVRNLRDFIGGKYIRLRYAISSVECGSLLAKDISCNNTKALLGKTIYVLYTETPTKNIEPMQFVLEKPHAGSMYIQGNIRDTSGKEIYIQYGIERFYIKRGQRIGKKQKSISVNIRVDTEGHATIERIAGD